MLNQNFLILFQRFRKGNQINKKNKINNLNFKYNLNKIADIFIEFYIFYYLVY
jgi:hypothetical protein